MARRGRPARWWHHTNFTVPWRASPNLAAMRRMLLMVVATAGLAIPAQAAGPDGTYRGQAKSLQSDFRYGKVIVKVKRSKVTYLEIEGVTTTGCGGYMDVVFAPNDPDTQIIGGSAKIRNGRFTVKYRPSRDIEDQDTFIKARFRGGRVSGTFESMSLCQNAGRFTATR